MTSLSACDVIPVICCQAILLLPRGVVAWKSSPWQDPPGTRVVETRPKIGQSLSEDF